MERTTKTTTCTRASRIPFTLYHPIILAGGARQYATTNHGQRVVLVHSGPIREDHGGVQCRNWCAPIHPPLVLCQVITRAAPAHVTWSVSFPLSPVRFSSSSYNRTPFAPELGADPTTRRALECIAGAAMGSLGGGWPMANAPLVSGTAEPPAWFRLSRWLILSLRACRRRRRRRRGWRQGRAAGAGRGARVPAGHAGIPLPARWWAPLPWPARSRCFTSERFLVTCMSAYSGTKNSTPSVQVWYAYNCVTQRPRRTLISLCDASTNEPAN
jgi:hypothetical protein